MYSSFVTLSLLPAAFAYGYGGSGTQAEAAASTPGATIEGVHVVKVGESGLTFSPSEVTAAVGDVVEFHFYPKAHSVAQSSFDAPCQPLNTTGFFSGPVPVDSGVGEQVFSVTIADEKPLWFYCATAKHCQGGMVGVVNAPQGKTLTQYADAAASAVSNVAPSATGGGTLGPAATEKPNAGIEARGDIRWGLMSAGLAMAGFFGGLML